MDQGHLHLGWDGEEPRSALFQGTILTPRRFRSVTSGFPFARPHLNLTADRPSVRDTDKPWLAVDNTTLARGLRIGVLRLDREPRSPRLGERFRV